MDCRNKFRSDYVALQDRLKTLPDKTTHNVMVIKLSNLMPNETPHNVMLRNLSNLMPDETPHNVMVRKLRQHTMSW